MTGIILLDILYGVRTIVPKENCFPPVRVRVWVRVRFRVRARTLVYHVFRKFSKHF